jgi:hypothetical protein
VTPARYLLELPEGDGPCRLWDRSTEPWKVVAEGTLEECRAAMEQLNRETQQA